MQSREYLREICLTVIKDVHASILQYLINTMKVFIDSILFREDLMNLFKMTQELRRKIFNQL